MTNQNQTGNSAENPKQVDRSHYNFSTYMTKARWCSVWHQIDEIQKLNPSSILEVGPGLGLLKTIGRIYGFTIRTLDFDPELKPDTLASATHMPIDDSSYDLVCAFQMLEHLPYTDALQAFGEMARVCCRNVIISLPDAKSMLHYQFYIPKLGHFDFLAPDLSYKPDAHLFQGEHYWEINKKGYSITKVISDLSVHARLIKTYLVRENPYHRFFIFEKIATLR